MISRSLVAVALLPLALGAPCGNSNPIVHWSSKVISSVGWFEGTSPISERLMVQGFMDNKQTMYQVLKDRNEFSMFVDYIDKVQDMKKLLDNKDISMTLFAPNNEAMEKVGMGGKGKHEKTEQMRQIIEYHLLPQAVEYKCFGQNSTMATELRADDGSFGGYRRRLKIESTSVPPRTVTINGYSVITQADIRASNGIIHKIDTPMFLPPDIMDGLFLVPVEFSMTTAALYKINLQKKYEYNAYEKGDKNRNDRQGKGTPATTFFAPTNEAWYRLPQDLITFLFSPSGETTLRKLMAFHTIPSDLVFSEWSRSMSDKKTMGVFDDDDDLSFEWDHQFPTLLANQKIPVHVKKTMSNVPGSKQYSIELQAHGLYAGSYDNVAQNGAVHTMDHVICPRHKEGQDKSKNTKDWEEWKDWLFEWSRNVEEA